MSARAWQSDELRRHRIDEQHDADGWTPEEIRDLHENERICFTCGLPTGTVSEWCGECYDSTYDQWLRNMEAAFPTVRPR